MKLKDAYSLERKLDQISILKSRDITFSTKVHLVKVIVFLPRNKRLIISWLQSPSAVILEPKKIKSVTVSPSVCHEVMGPDAMILVFWMLSFMSTFSLSSFINRLLSAYLRLLIFLPAILIPACASSSLAFHMMYSAHKLNKQGDNIQPWCTPFQICS